MIKYRLDCLVDDAHLAPVMAVIINAGIESEYDPHVKISIPGSFSSEFPKDAPLVTGTRVTAEPKAKPPARRAIKRRLHTNGGQWPAEGSIYDVVFKAIQTAPPQTSEQLREALKTGGFSAQSLNSAMVRLEKAQKVKKSPEGWVAA